MTTGSDSAARALVIIPAYNESTRVGAVARKVLGTPAAVPLDVLVVDDGSSDDTANAARASGAHVVSLVMNLGYGNALRTGYLYAARGGYRAVVQLDGDGQHDPASIPALLAPVLSGDADIVVGTRFHDASNYRMVGTRRLGQRLFAGLMRWMGRVDIVDVTSGYQALGPRAIALYTSDAFPADYPDANVLLLAALHGLRIVEIPAAFHERSGGASMHRGILRPLYYIYKMIFSMGLIYVRARGNRQGDRTG